MGTMQSNYMIAQLCAVVVNVISSIFAGKGRHPKQISPLDFIPDWSGRAQRDGKTAPKKAETVDEMKSFITQFAKANVKKRKRPIKNGRNPTAN